MKNLFCITLLFGFFACTSDPCEDVNCLNGGVCESGLCDCPEGYSGTDCSIESTPLKLIVSKGVVNSYPELNPSGEPWDNSTTPDTGFADIFFAITEIGAPSGFLLRPSSTEDSKEHCNPSEEHEFYAFENIEFTNLHTLHGVGLSDNDAITGDDIIGSVNFTPIDVISGFPTEIFITASGIEITLTVTYEF